MELTNQVLKGNDMRQKTFLENLDKEVSLIGREILGKCDSSKLISMTTVLRCKIGMRLASLESKPVAKRKITEQEYKDMLNEADDLIGKMQGGEDLTDIDLEHILSIAMLTGEYENEQASS